MGAETVTPTQELASQTNHLVDLMNDFYHPGDIEPRLDLLFRTMSTNTTLLRMTEEEFQATPAPTLASDSPQTSSSQERSVLEHMRSVYQDFPEFWETVFTSGYYSTASRDLDSSMTLSPRQEHWANILDLFAQDEDKAKEINLGSTGILGRIINYRKFFSLPDDQWQSFIEERFAAFEPQEALRLQAMLSATRSVYIDDPKFWDALNKANDSFTTYRLSHYDELAEATEPAESAELTSEQEAAFHALIEATATPTAREVIQAELNYRLRGVPDAVRATIEQTEIKDKVGERRLLEETAALLLLSDMPIASQIELYRDSLGYNEEDRPVEAFARARLDSLRLWYMGEGAIQGLMIDRRKDLAKKREALNAISTPGGVKLETTTSTAASETASPKENLPRLYELLGVSQSDLNDTSEDGKGHEIVLEQGYLETVGIIQDPPTAQAFYRVSKLICNGLVKEFARNIYDEDALAQENPVIFLPRIVWNKMFEERMFRAYYGQQDEQNPVPPEIFTILSSYGRYRG